MNSDIYFQIKKNYDMIWFTLHLINNIGQDLLNKKFFEPLIDLCVDEMNHDLAVLVSEGDQKLGIFNIEPQVLLVLDSDSQPETLYLKIHLMILPQLEKLTM